MAAKHPSKKKSQQVRQKSVQAKTAGDKRGNPAADGPSGFKMGLKTQTAAIYAATMAACLLAAFWVLQLWQADFSIPFIYKGDGLVIGVWVKSVIDNGWFLYNNYVGAPNGLAMADYPTADNLHYIIMKVIALFTGNFAWTMNIFFLATFPLTAASSLFVFRKLNISYPTAVFGSLLYTFLPYHLVRGESHLFLAAIYIIPLTALLILRIGSEAPPFIKLDGRGKVTHDLKTWRTAGFVAIAVLTASAGIYYAFFACVFLVAVGAYAAYRYKSPYRLLVAGIAAAIVGVFLMINLGPTFSYQSKNGGNEDAAKRLPVESEMYGMTISQLILPITNHRLDFLADMKKELNEGVTYVHQDAVFNNENDWASLGLIGSVGFLFSLAWLAAGRKREIMTINTNRSLLDTIGLLNLTGILIGTMGGLGLIFALLVTPDIRAYNRVSPYIAFFSIAVVLVLLEGLRRRFFESGKRSLIFYAVLLVALFIGILDQTNESMVPFYGLNKTEYASDEDFFRKVESSMPPEALIFQLPYMTFPEGDGVNKVLIYDHFRAYLHSSTLHWSYGVMKGRPGDLWQRFMVSQPTNKMLKDLVAAGFKGIYINRGGYPDNANNLQRDLEAQLRQQPLTNASNTLLFFNISNYAAANS